MPNAVPTLMPTETNPEPSPGASPADPPPNAASRERVALLVRRYQQVQDHTAAPDQVLLQVFEGLLRQIDRALAHLEKQELEEKNTCLLKAQTAVYELMTALQPSVGEEVYRNLRGLYFFAYRRIAEGNVRNDRSLIAEARAVLARVGESWREVVASYRHNLPSEAAGANTSPPPGGAGLCVQC